jgi:hypothetical protein
MDNLKFGAWIHKDITQEDSGFMHYPNDNSDFELVSDGAGFSLLVDNEDWADDSKFEVVQYTGYNYKDTNEEMYTGDVVYIAGYGNCEIVIDKFYGIMLKKDDQEHPLVDSIIEGDFPVKLGNKYENPELLGGENG